MNGVSSLVDPNQQPAATAPSGLATEDQIKKLYGDYWVERLTQEGYSFIKLLIQKKLKRVLLILQSIKLGRLGRFITIY